MGITDPVASYIAGAALFDVVLSPNAFALGLAGALITAGVVLLANSPTLHDERDAEPIPHQPTAPADRTGGLRQSALQRWLSVSDACSMTVARLHQGSDVEYGPAMRCALCDRPDATFGDLHLCVADGGGGVESAGSAPASAWRVTGWILLVITSAYLVACAAKIVVLTQDYGFVDRLTTNADSVDLTELNRLASRERAVGAVVQLLVLGYLVGFTVWLAIIWRVVLRNGLDPRKVLRHWTVVAWTAAMVVSPVLAFFTRDSSVGGVDLAAARGDLLAFDRNQIAFTLVRMLVGALLIAAVWALRNRVKTTIFGELEAIVQLR